MPSKGAQQPRNAPALDLDPNSNSARKCGQCKKSKEPGEFPVCRPGTRQIATCNACSARKKAVKAKHTDKENGRVCEREANVGLDGSTVLSLEDFLAILKERGTVLDVEARVDLAAVNSIPGRREKADKITGLVWEVLG